MPKARTILEGTGNVNSSIFINQTAHRGLLQVKTFYPVAFGIMWSVQGRVRPDADWVVIVDIIAADLPSLDLGVTHSLFVPINLMHEMQVLVTVGNVETTHTIYLQEY